MDSGLKMWTVGYEGRTIAEVITLLSEADVEMVIDVRRRPLSRKPRFSKRALAQDLASVGIEYQHMPELGMPTELLPKRSPRDGNAEVLAAYRAYLPGCEASLDALRQLASQRSLCLLCFEADAHHCHREIVSACLEREGQLEIVHL